MIGWSRRRLQNRISYRERPLSSLSIQFCEQNKFALIQHSCGLNRTTLPLVAESHLVLCTRYALLFAEGRLPSSCFCLFLRLLYAVTPKPPRRANGRR